jgi:hypothetical protein
MIQCCQYNVVFWLVMCARDSPSPRTIVVQTAQTRAMTRPMCASTDDFHNVFHRNCEDRRAVCR